MKEYYAARAREYDKVYAKPERQADLRAMECWLPPIFENREVLEIACGTGHWTQFFAPRARRVVAIDAAQETIDIAKGRVAKDKVEFIVGDAYALPPIDSKFDAGFAGFWYSHIPKSRIAEFLRGFHSYLKPGARVVFMDNRFSDDSNSPIAGRDAEGNTYQMRKLEDGSEHRVLKNFPTEQELHDAVSLFGTEINYKAWQYYFALEYKAR